MILLVTDYGLHGPYVGQMLAVLHRKAPAVPAINLFADAPVCNPKATSYLLAAYRRAFPPGAVFLCVVDPGVGSGEHRPVVVKIDDHWFVGPDNGLFEITARQGSDARLWSITWRPEHLSSTFHGRDLYAPTAARLATGMTPVGEPEPFCSRYDWPDDLYEVVYIDHFGNAMTGIRASSVEAVVALTLKSQSLKRMRTFADVPPGEGFWYENANGLVEIAVNRGRADTTYGLTIGDAVHPVRA
jgi:S-adenosylmethionine hydrolase